MGNIGTTEPLRLQELGGLKKKGISIADDSSKNYGNMMCGRTKLHDAVPSMLCCKLYEVKLMYSDVKPNECHCTELSTFIECRYCHKMCYVQASWNFMLRQNLKWYQEMSAFDSCQLLDDLNKHSCFKFVNSDLIGESFSVNMS
jgi:hypothetical protein